MIKSGMTCEHVKNMQSAGLIRQATRILKVHGDQISSEVVS